MEGERLAGLVCLEDLRKVPREAWTTTTVRQIMTPAGDLVVTTPEEEVTAALHRLVGRDVSQIPVLQAGRFVGMLRHRDIARRLELQSKGAGFGEAILSAELQYYLGAGFHLGLKLGGALAIGDVSAERADGSRIFKSSPWSATVLAGVGFRF